MSGIFCDTPPSRFVSYGGTCFLSLFLASLCSSGNHADTAVLSSSEGAFEPGVGDLRNPPNPVLYLAHFIRGLTLALTGFSLFRSHPTAAVVFYHALRDVPGTTDFFCYTHGIEVLAENLFFGEPAKFLHFHTPVSSLRTYIYTFKTILLHSVVCVCVRSSNHRAEHSKS